MKYHLILSLILPLFILAACTKGKGEYGLQSPQNEPEILYKTVSEDGISVVFREGKDTFALDFLSTAEFDSIFGGHSCKWKLCPYRGVKTAPGEWNESVFQYTECEEGSDCYYIDMLHLQHPNKEYEELEDLLFRIDRDSGDDASVFNDNLETSYTNHKNKKP